MSEEVEVSYAKENRFRIEDDLTLEEALTMCREFFSRPSLGAEVTINKSEGTGFYTIYRKSVNPCSYDEYLAELEGI